MQSQAPGTGGRAKGLQAAAKQSGQAARTSLPSGLQISVFTGKDKTSEHLALCRAAKHKITEWPELEAA